MPKKHWVVAGVALGSGVVVAKMVANKRIENKAVDDGNPYLNCIENSISKDDTGTEGRLMVRHIPTIYEEHIKPVIDRMLSFGGLVGLSPLYALISLAIVLDDPGPVFFTQKRVGKDKHFFMLHKFRTMKMSAPHDIPTHQLKNPEQYITRVGRFLRKASLDELPQVWDIFRGQMSFIGPRPALWNQADLVAERDKYGVNNVLPGLTGWAQINGRDELEIPVKAKLDGEYVADVSFGMDVRCFFGTIWSVVRHEGVVEGGTGAMG